MVRSSELTQRIDLQTGDVLSGAYGEDSVTWQLWKTVWASVKPQAGSERIRADKLDGAQRFLIKIRYLAGVLPTMRIKHKAVYYQIEGITNVNSRDRVLELVCTVDNGATA